MLVLVIAIITAFVGWLANKAYTDGNRKLNLFTLIFTHIQVLVGLFLYFKSPLSRPADMASAMKDSTLRYWTMEHVVMMLVAVILITVGHAKSKKLSEALAKHRTIAIFFTLGLIVVIAAIIQSGRPLLGMTR
jgi:hypothetical protein